MERQTNEPPGLRKALRCGARNRSGNPCQSPVVKGKRRCRMHGGAHGSGAPKGPRNGNYKHGRYTAEAIAERRELMSFIREARARALSVLQQGCAPDGSVLLRQIPVANRQKGAAN
jgi:hypothetical protein